MTKGWQKPEQNFEGKIFRKVSLKLHNFLVDKEKIDILLIICTFINYGTTYHTNSMELTRNYEESIDIPFAIRLLSFSYPFAIQSFCFPFWVFNSNPINSNDMHSLLLL